MPGDNDAENGQGFDQREGLKAALLDVKEGRAAGIVVYSLDRLARRLTTQEAILGMAWDAGATVFSLGDNGEVHQDDPDDPMRTAIRQMRGVFAELDRALIVKRLRDGKRAKARRGAYVGAGSPPFGTRVAEVNKGGRTYKTLEADPAEQAVIDVIRRLRAEGRTLREIVDELHARGFEPRPRRVRSGPTRGETTRGQWNPETVRRILARAEGVEPGKRRKVHRRRKAGEST